jgi:hypothetical protein
VILAKALGPAGFAPAASLFVYTSLCIQVSDLGLGFVMHSSDIDEPIPGRNLFVMRAVGTANAVGMLGLAGALGNATLAFASLIWAASAESYVRKAAALRRGDTRRVVTAEIAGALSFSGVLVVAALAESVPIFASAVVTKLVVESIVAGRLATVEHGARRPWRNEWVGQLLTFAASNVDYLVVIAVLSPAALSIYLMAFRLTSAVPAVAAQPLTQETLLQLAAADRTAAAGIVRSVRARSLRLGLVAVGVAALAGVGLEALLGPAWRHLALATVVLAPMIPFRLILGVSVAALLRAGQAGRVVRAEWLRLALVAGSVAIGARYGVVAAAAGAMFATVASIWLLHLTASSAIADMAGDQARS